MEENSDWEDEAPDYGDEGQEEYEARQKKRIGGETDEDLEELENGNK